MRCCWISTARYSWSIQRANTGFGSRPPGSLCPDRPHGLSYSLTLHGPDGSRLVGFDTAHAVRESQGPGGKGRGRDHKHRMETVRPYRFKDAVTLLEDFWAEVDGVLREKGVV